jgi:hypothetical protein|tara:strand:+ start:234 stop:512 length:279 start_codon:yes stop_codon:yes gene_type:complete
MAFRGNNYFKKQKGRNAGKHPYTKEDMRRVGWCMQKNILIAVIPNWKGGFDDWRVEIKINGKIHLDPKTYNGYDAQTKMYEYYKYYYDKNKR